MCGGSPLICYFQFWLLLFLIHIRVGEITQGRFIFNTRSPLSEPDDYSCGLFLFITCRGDSQGSSNYSTLVLPSLNRNIL